MKPRLIILGSDRDDLGYLYQQVQDIADVCGVVIEKPVGRLKVFGRRVKRFGLIQALGQAKFVLFFLPVIRFMSSARVKEIREKYAFDKNDIPSEFVHQVLSVNDDKTASLIQQLAPTTALVYGTRLIASRTLKKIGIPFINIHAGITPRYRGGHGAYWALAEGKPELAGVTVHRIDAGIDTGEILAQSLIHPTSADTIVTYPLLQLREGARLVCDLLAGHESHQLIKTEETTDRLYTHPSVWEYLFYLSKGVH